MKVQLIVVRGKPEGKAIPLTVPKFKIGRGEGCHLRPNSDQVSREHAEFIVEGGVVAVRDLKSRNGTQVNGKDITGAVRLKDRDLVQVGPLTFAVSILGAPAPAQPAPTSPGQPAAPSQPAQPAVQGRSAPEEVLNEDIDSWLVGAPSESSTEIPTSVYGGETVTIATYQGGKAETPPLSASAEEDDEEEDDEELEEEEDDEDEEELAEEDDDEDEDEEDEDEAEDDPPLDELIDESNPFHAAKKAQKQAETTEAKGAGAANQQFQDTSGAAGEILRKLMERRRASR